MVHRRLQQGLLRVHGSVEDSYKTRATPIPMNVGTFAARQKTSGAQSDDSSEGRDENRPDHCDYWYF